MLHIRMMSVEHVAEIPVEEVSDVRTLKHHRIYGLPPRFTQRLSCCGNLLDDAAELEMPMELELVLLPFPVADPVQASELLTAATNGSISKVGCFQPFLPIPSPQPCFSRGLGVEALLQQPQLPDVLDERGRSPLMRAAHLATSKFCVCCWRPVPTRTSLPTTEAALP